MWTMELRKAHTKTLHLVFLLTALSEVVFCKKILLYSRFTHNYLWKSNTDFWKFKSNKDGARYRLCTQGDQTYSLESRFIERALSIYVEIQFSYMFEDVKQHSKYLLLDYTGGEDDDISGSVSLNPEENPDILGEKSTVQTHKYYNYTLSVVIDNPKNCGFFFKFLSKSGCLNICCIQVWGHYPLSVILPPQRVRGEMECLSPIGNQCLEPESFHYSWYRDAVLVGSLHKYPVSVDDGKVITLQCQVGTIISDGSVTMQEKSAEMYVAAECPVYVKPRDCCQLIDGWCEGYVIDHSFMAEGAPWQPSRTSSVQRPNVLAVALSLSILACRGIYL